MKVRRVETPRRKTLRISGVVFQSSKPLKSHPNTASESCVVSQVRMTQTLCLHGHKAGFSRNKRG